MAVSSPLGFLILSRQVCQSVVGEGIWQLVVLKLTVKSRVLRNDFGIRKDSDTESYRN